MVMREVHGLLGHAVGRGEVGRLEVCCRGVAQPGVKAVGGTAQLVQGGGVTHQVTPVLGTSKNTPLIHRAVICNPMLSV